MGSLGDDYPYGTKDIYRGIAVEYGIFILINIIIIIIMIICFFFLKSKGILI